MRSDTTRRALLRNTTITLMGVTAGCLGQSDENGDPPQSTETGSPPTRNDPDHPPLINATPRRSTPEPPTAVVETTSSTPTPRKTTRPTTTPSPASTETKSLTPTTPPSKRTTTRPTTTPSQRTTTQPTTTPSQRTTTQPTTTSTPSHREHPYLSVGSGTAKFGVDRSRYPVMGTDHAPVEILYWSDYLCEFCSQFATSIHPKLIRTEVQRGRTRFVFLELPNIGQNSWPAAMLSKAVWKTVADTDPAQFWQWHQTVFERQRKAGSGWANTKNLLEIATEVGIDANAVETVHDTHSDAFASDIDAAVDAADQASITGTPAFYVYNPASDQSKTIIGTQPLSVYRSAIRAVK
ncbi:DsbA family protein [Halocatena pleomorpha]|uniref:Thioredoxin-like fold domain-containing protein n=1 Tax=Halocatena pleomorpha TaxID=1785090 RepID=A0A3P3RIV0_9EURY|nr:thioredoxin domain-containing protein [Halocatena pleomorpha]RRJ32343.1 hypothetical protein EIK79_04955 [Halocatena pleomorpha]